MKTSRRDISIDMVIHRGIFKNNQITLFPCFTFVPKTGVSFYCDEVITDGYPADVVNFSALTTKRKIRLFKWKYPGHPGYFVQVGG